VIARLEELEAARGRGAVTTGRGVSLELSSLDKVYFPKARLTKGHVMRYYAAIAPIVLPLIKDRPLVLRRFPDGLAGKTAAFFQQSAPDKTPRGVLVEHVDTADGKEPRIHGGNLTTLLYGVQIGAIELNPWHSRVGSLEYADYIVLDLDPGPRSAFAQVVHAALWIREVLDELGFSAAVKTSGGRGMHVYLPLPPRVTFQTARTAADIIAHTVAARHPRDTTLVRALKQRPPNAVYLDVGQNDYGKSVAAPFSVRAREPAPVSTPLEWNELVDSLDPTTFTIDSVLPAAERRADVWRRGLRHPVDLERLTKTRGRRARPKTTRRARSTA
jgi:bifunctional non-homologous end joining protein LigD